MKVLFLIHDLAHGGAEKVLVNLVNNMDSQKFDITVMTLFDVGINRQFLNGRIKYKTCFKKLFPANSYFMKLFTPAQLHKMFIKEKFDIEIAYLEGPCTRIISGCPFEDTKKVAWVHSTANNYEELKLSFRSTAEAIRCYNKFSKIVCVSNSIKNKIAKLLSECKTELLYNTNESQKIIRLSKEPINVFDNKKINIISVGTLKQIKGFDRLIDVHLKLISEGYNIHTYILGQGPQKSYLEKLIEEKGLQSSFTLLGYDTNPYKYVSKSDLFVCSSYSEGFSTAATEALIVGTPVCTVNVSGMKEMLGENNEYGVVVNNTDEALYEGIKNFLDDPELLVHYKKKALERGKTFSTENTVKSVENMLLNLN